jgi:hypothetical protein
VSSDNAKMCNRIRSYFVELNRSHPDLYCTVHAPVLALPLYAKSDNKHKFFNLANLKKCSKLNKHLLTHQFQSSIYIILLLS